MLKTFLLFSWWRLLGPWKGHGKTVHQNGSIDTSFNPPQCSLDSNFNILLCLIKSIQCIFSKLGFARNITELLYGNRCAAAASLTLPLFANLMILLEIVVKKEKPRWGKPSTHISLSLMVKRVHCTYTRTLYLLFQPSAFIADGVNIFSRSDVSLYIYPIRFIVVTLKGLSHELDWAFFGLKV